MHASWLALPAGECDEIKRLFRSLGRFNALKFLAGLEADRFAGRNVDFLAGAGIAADAGLARLDHKDSEAAQLNALAAAESDLQGLENGLNGLLGLCTADTRRGDDGVYDVQLNHACLPRAPCADARVCAAGCQGHDG